MQLCFLESFSSDDKRSEILVCAFDGLCINKVIQNSVFKIVSYRALRSALQTLVYAWCFCS